MKNKIIILTALTAISLLAMSGVSLAATKNNNLNVTASVVANGNITTMTDISWAFYYTTDLSNSTLNGDITFQLTKNTSYKVYISGTRSMIGAGGDTLLFELWADAGYTVPFPSDNSGAPASAPSNAPITKTVYGRIPAGQDVGVDSYSMVLAVNVEY
jgi:spore coat protein U-like protein